MITYQGASPFALLGNIGDEVFFVSDVWHRRMPTTIKDKGRLFLQVQYGRRDIAQRLQTTDRVNCLSDEAIGRIKTDRQKTVVRLHLLGFITRRSEAANRR